MNSNTSTTSSLDEQSGFCRNPLHGALLAIRPPLVDLYTHRAAHPNPKAKRASQWAPNSAAPVPLGMAPQVRAGSSLGVSMRFCCALCHLFLVLSTLGVGRGGERRGPPTTQGIPAAL